MIVRVVLVLLGVLICIERHASFRAPLPTRSSGWLRSAGMVNPTIPTPSSPSPRTLFNGLVNSGRNDVSPDLTGKKDLSSLKTGMKLEGIVVNSTPFAAFIDADVVRPAKGDSFAAVHGMLHKSDVSAPVLRSLRALSRTPPRSSGPQPLLEKRTPVTVYVKEVFKQSGRFTVTTDPNIRKEDVVEQHERTKMEGQERRQTRRLRRQLEDVAAGTTVTGCVKKVVKEGVLVTITSLGPLEVTGLIPKADLPEQFQVPSGLRETFQTQLLEQDFTPGRMITCGVTQVHPNPSAALVYNMKLLFEDFREPPMDVTFTDKFDTMTEREKNAFVMGRKLSVDEDAVEDNDDHTDGERDFEEEFGNYDEELRASFDELLAGGQGTSMSKDGERLLAAADLYAWDEMQDMIEDGVITAQDVEDALASVGVQAQGDLSFDQFDEVVSFLQDRIDSNGAENDELDTGDAPQGEQWEEKHELSRDNVQIRLTGSASEQALYGSHGEDDVEDEGAAALEEFDEAVMEAFNHLKGADNRVSVDKFRKWEDIRDMLEVGAVTQEELDSILREVVPATQKGGKKATASMDFEQFEELMLRLDEVAGLHAEPDVEGEGANHEDNEQDEEDGDQQEELRRELFEEMSDASGVVPVRTFLDWEEIESLVAQQVLDPNALRAMIKEVGSSPKGKLDYEQFCDLLSMIEEITENLDDDAEEPNTGNAQAVRRQPSAKQVARSVDERELQRGRRVAIEGEGEGAHDDEDYATDEGSQAEDEDEDEDEPTPEELDEMARAIFDELKPAGKSTVPVKAFVNWDGLTEEIDAGLVTKAEVMKVVKGVDKAGKGELNFEQFLQAMDELEEIMASRADDEERFIEPDQALPQGKGPKSQPAAQQASGKGFGSNAAPKASRDVDQEIEQLTADLYNEMKGKDKLLSVKKLEQWEELQDLLASGTMKRSALERALQQIGARESGYLTLQQFHALLDSVQEKIEMSHLDASLLDEALGGTDDDDDDDDDENPTSEVASSQHSTKQPTKQAPKQATTSTVATSARNRIDTSRPDALRENWPGAADYDTSYGSGEQESEDYSDDGEVEISEEAAAMEIYDELRGDKDSATVADFLHWEDVQELLGTGALRRDALAAAMGKCEVNVDAGEETELPFETFFQLIQEIDQHVDHSKLGDDTSDVVMEERVEATGPDDAETIRKIMDDFNARTKGPNGAKISYQQSNGQVMHGDEAIDAMQQDNEERELTAAESDREVVEMFEELSKGKPYITVKALRKWDELQGLIEAELLTPAALDSYLKRLDTKDGKVTLDVFRDFVTMLDTVLVDEQGNILGLDEADRAVDLGDVLG